MIFELEQKECEEANNMNSWGKAGAEEGSTKATVRNWGSGESKTNKAPALVEFTSVGSI